MTDEKWGDLLFMVQEKFGIESREHEPIIETDDSGADVRRGEKEVITFTTPEGRIRIERHTRPLVVDKKYHYHKTAGSGARVEYIYSETEKTHSLQAFREGGGGWEEIDTSLPFGGR